MISLEYEIKKLDMIYPKLVLDKILGYYIGYVNPDIYKKIRLLNGLNQRNYKILNTYWFDIFRCESYGMGIGTDRKHHIGPILYGCLLDAKKRLL